MTRSFPFGRSVTPRQPSASSARSVFLLGAYPSALHVEWHPPPPLKRIQALAVDNEPEPFWNGCNQRELVHEWMRLVSFDDRWGQIRETSRFNGPCGQKLGSHVFAPMQMASADAWITDCLDTYRGSRDLSVRIGNTYNPWAAAAGVRLADVAPHPSETDIVREALQLHHQRLMRELRSARPDVILTLGNAALRVVRELTRDTDGPKKLDISHYGLPRIVRIDGRAIRWFALAHPAAPRAYQDAHSRWASRGELKH